MSNYPEDLRYTKEHEWIRFLDGGVAVVGITHFAQKELGDIVYLELPEVGKSLQQGKIFGTIESVKAVSDLYAPASGEVLDRNEELMDHPEGVNQDPHGKAWMIRIKLKDPKEIAGLMTAADYAKHVESASH